MGVIYSRLTRPIRTFNIANRAEKIISQEKPVPAPQYASTKKQKKLANEANPEFLEKHYQKNIQLDDRLKNVFVTSTDPQKINPKIATAERSLPQIKYGADEFNMDYYDSAVIPEGKCTLRQAFTFISQHKKDPIKYSSENIAVQYKVDKTKIDDILKHFKSYMSFIPNRLDEPTDDTMQQVFDFSYKKMKKLKEEDKEK